MRTQTLYRPVGLKELQLVAQSGWKCFPPRLEWQPVFYPVLNQIYAAQIASEWNVADAFSGYLGAVTAFEVDETFCAKYPVQNVGGSGHDELWIPAEELEDFNAHIFGKVRIIQAFFGRKFSLPYDRQLSEVLSNWQAGVNKNIPK